MPLRIVYHAHKNWSIQCKIQKSFINRKNFQHSRVFRDQYQTVLYIYCGYDSWVINYLWENFFQAILVLNHLNVIQDCKSITYYFIILF